MKCNIELFIGGRWIVAAAFEAGQGQEEYGYRGSGVFDYEVAFGGEYLFQPDAAVSVRFPVDFTQHRIKSWPAFLLDMLPAGAARRDILNRMGIQDGPTADWVLLLEGAGNPIGNLRIAQAAVEPPNTSHPGFNREEIIQRGDSFIEYAREHGANVSGSTGAQGDAPKFLLVEDIHGYWHADQALPDQQVAHHWLVKFPRGKSKRDRQVLRNEHAYYAVAKEAGLDVGKPLLYEENTLFIPRFDRELEDGVVLRYGVESLCAAAGITEFGAHPSQEKLLQTIYKFSDNPQEDITEFLLRDMMNVALGNTDNHPRNTAFIKRGGNVRLSPLYDFAPMVLDDQGIARACRWESHDNGGRPEWVAIVAGLNFEGIDLQKVATRIGQFAHDIDNLPAIMLRHGVDQELLDQVGGRIRNVQKNLAPFL